MGKRVWPLAFCMALALNAAAGTEMMSEGTFIFVNAKTSSYWHTATNCVLALPIEFPEGASSATLTVSGLRYSATYSDITASPFLLSLPPATSTATENVYDLALDFGNGVVRTAKLGLIKGYDATTVALTRCLAPKEQRKWGWVKGRCTVFPIPYGMTSFTVGGVVTDTGLGGDQGWYALDVPAGQTIPLTLDELSATLFGQSEATTIRLR